MPGFAVRPSGVGLMAEPRNCISPDLHRELTEYSEGQKALDDGRTERCKGCMEYLRPGHHCPHCDVDLILIELSIRLADRTAALHRIVNMDSCLLADAQEIARKALSLAHERQVKADE